MRVSLVLNMVVRHHVQGFQEFISLVEKVYKPDEKPVVVMFSGDKDAQGNSWCPDCVDAEPGIEKALSQLDDENIFIHCAVGGRDFWKDPACIFRTDSRTKLSSVPTLMRWGSKLKIDGGKAGNTNLVKMLFEDDD